MKFLFNFLYVWYCGINILMEQNVYAGTGIRTDSGAIRVSIRPRKIKTPVEDCKNCHLKKMRFFVDPRKQPERNHQNKDLRHGKTEVACGVCHDPNEQMALRTSIEAPTHFENSSPVCMQCHVDIYRDWEQGIHGKRLGGWNLPSEQVQCSDCHDPHSVSYQTMRAEPPPVKTKFTVDKTLTHKTLNDKAISGKFQSDDPKGRPSLATSSAYKKLVTSVTMPIEDRTPKIENFPCLDCHKQIKSGMPEKTKVHIHFDYQHVKTKKSCLLCHSPFSPDKLVMLDGTSITMNQSSELCGQCHGPKFLDWKQNLHGKDYGKGTANSYKLACTSCHNAHSPKFKKLIADPHPRPPKFKKDQEYESK
jgi:formate-dependent nitrite reductase cytochrome c552 subunit